MLFDEEEDFEKEFELNEVLDGTEINPFSQEEVNYSELSKNFQQKVVPVIKKVASMGYVESDEVAICVQVLMQLNTAENTKEKFNCFAEWKKAGLEKLVWEKNKFAPEDRQPSLQEAYLLLLTAEFTSTTTKESIMKSLNYHPELAMGNLGTRLTGVFHRPAINQYLTLIDSLLDNPVLQYSDVVKLLTSQNKQGKTIGFFISQFDEKLNINWLELLEKIFNKTQDIALIDSILSTHTPGFFSSSQVAYEALAVNRLPNSDKVVYQLIHSKFMQAILQNEQLQKKHLPTLAKLKDRVLDYIDSLDVESAKAIIEEIDASPKWEKILDEPRGLLATEADTGANARLQALRLKNGLPGVFVVAKSIFDRSISPRVTEALEQVFSLGRSR